MNATPSTRPTRTRLLDDAVTAAAIRYEGAASRAWQNLENETVRRCRFRLGWDRSTQWQRDVIDLAVTDACVWLYQQAILGRRWNPEGGATLVGSAVRYARLRHTHHLRYAKPQRPSEEELQSDFDDIPSRIDVAAAVEAAAHLDDFRNCVGEHIWSIATAQTQGWTLAELAETQGVSPQTLATRLWRHRHRYVTQHRW